MSTDDFCVEPPIPPSGSKLKLVNWDGKPLRYDLNFTYACDDENIMLGMPEATQVFQVPCPIIGTIAWPTCADGMYVGHTYLRASRLQETTTCQIKKIPLLHLMLI